MLAVRGWTAVHMNNHPADRRLLALVQARLHRIVFRFCVLTERLAAGTLTPPRPRHRPGPRPAPAASPDAALPKTPPRPRERLPEKPGWLVRIVGPRAAYGPELERLLAGAEMQALIRAAPQVGRLLRPLCRMLGVVPDPAILPPPPPRPPRVRPAPPAPDPAAPVPTEPAEKPMRKRPLRTEARTRKPKWTYPGTEWRKWGGFWFPEPIRKPA